jgi:hypothetical protein
MEAANLEQSSGDTSPVFATGRRHRSHAVRLAAAALGILLAGWLAALVAGLVGFSPLPKLTFPDTDGARTPAVADEGGSGPTLERDAGAHASAVAADASQVIRGQAHADAGADASRATTPSGSVARVAPGQGVGEATGSAPPQSGGGATESPPSPSPGASPASPGNGPPSFTPPASGEKSATPPRGNSADAPGQAVSVDPPGRARRPNSG